MPMPRKPTHLHAVDGTYRSDRHGDRENEPQPEGKPVKPKFLKGRASEIWDEYAAVCYWLTAADSHSFATWCSLAAELERGVKKMVASRISQMRALGSELGTSGPGTRSRINVGNALKNGSKGKEKSNGADSKPADKNYA